MSTRWLPVTTAGRRRPVGTLAKSHRPSTKPAAAMRAVSKLGKLGLATLAFAAGCTSSDEGALSVVISLPEQRVPLATKVTLVVDYAGTGARLLSEKGGPACAFTLPNVDGDFSDDRQGTLTIHASGPHSARGPADIAACRMKPGDESVTAAELSSRLTVRVEGAEDAAGKPIDVAAAAAVRHRDGRGAGDVLLSESDIEQAQAKAVNAVAAIVKATRDNAEPNAAATGSTDSGKGRSATAGRGTNPAAMGAATAPPATARAATPMGIALARGAAVPGGSAPEAVDDSATPTNDRDPSYDDSPADDDTVPSYSLEFSVQTAGQFGALQFDINHLGNSGGFIGRGGGVDCVAVDTGALLASNYLGERLARVGLIKVAGIDTPAAVARCGFRTRENLSPGSFHIEVRDAADTDSIEIESPPSIVVSSIMPRR